MTNLVAMAKRLQNRCTQTYLGIKNFIVRREEGASLVEYALLVALIALACVAAIGLLGNSISNAFNNIGNKING